MFIMIKKIFCKKTIKKENFFLKRKISFISLFILLILTNFLLINLFGPNSEVKISNNFHTNNKNNNFNAYTIDQKLTAGTTIGSPHLSITQPTPQQSETVTSNISDANGIKNASIFWQYSTLPSLSYNTSMSSSYISLFTSSAQNPWNSSSYLNDTTGNFVSTQTHHQYFEYTFSPGFNNLFSYFGITVNRNQTAPGNNNPNNYLENLQLYGKNITTNQWSLFYTFGTNTSTSTSKTILAVSTTNSSTSYKVVVVMYDSSLGTINIPTASGISASITQYSSTIPVPPSPVQNKPASVTYWIAAFNNLNQRTQSPNYTFLFDHPPTDSFYQMTNTVLDTSSQVIRVKVTDLDGVADIVNTTVKGVFYTDNPLKNNTFSMQLESNLDSTNQVYNATVNFANLVSLSKSVSIVVYAYDKLGLQAKTSKIFNYDTAGPSMIAYSFNTTKDLTGQYYVYDVNQTPEFFATMTDPSGIKEVTFNYNVNNGLYATILMTNMTFNNQSITTMVFNATLPSYKISTNITWYLTSHDFGNNLNRTSTYPLYFDGDAPVLVQQIFNPPYVSNVTSPYLLFNVTDTAGALTPIVYYSYNYQLTWTQIVAAPLDYNSTTYYRNSTTYNYKGILPWQIPSNQITNISQRIVFGGTVDQAILTLGVSFTQGTFLRVYIENDRNTTALLFDRVSGNIINGIYTYDLIKLGFSRADFVNSTFFLICQSYSNVYYGQINLFSIQLRTYNIPLGYQYVIHLPASNNDTMGYYFFDLKDIFNHEVNTTIYSFYIDGDTPSVNVTSQITSPFLFNLKGAPYVNVTASIYDKGGIFLVEVYYKVNNVTSLNDWKILSLYTNIISGNIVAHIPIDNVNGTVFYKLRVYDNVGFSISTQEYRLDYYNGNNPNFGKSGGSGIIGLLLPIIGVSAVVVVVGAGLYFIIPKMKKSSKLSAVKNRISSKRPPPT